jgi:SAM-dependent methyltransferase
MIAAMRAAWVGKPSLRFQGQRGAAYFARQNRLAERGAELNLWKFKNHLEPTDTVVDFGCGTGALLQRVPGDHKIGVEVNELARQKARERGIETYAAANDLPDETADVVISNHALEHTLDPLAELRELHRALKPGGTLILWLPLDDWRSQRRLRPDDPDNHLYTWTPRLLGNLLREAAFELRTVRVETTAWRHNYVRFSRSLPPRLYRALTYLTAVVLRRRQLCAVARKPS